MEVLLRVYRGCSSCLTPIVNGRPQARPQVSGALCGPLLGEAAHRLVKNSLQIKNTSNAWLLDTPNRNYLYMVAKPRPAGPSGYERGFQDANYHYHYSGPNPRASSNPRPAHLFADAQSNRQNFRVEGRANSQEQYNNLRTGMSTLAIKDGPGVRLHARTPNAGSWTNQQQSTGFFSNQQQQHVQSPGPPPQLPPTNWIDRQPSIGYPEGLSKQEISSRVMYQQQQQQQVSKVYQIKPWAPENPSDFGRQQ